MRYEKKNKKNKQLLFFSICVVYIGTMKITQVNSYAIYTKTYWKKKKLFHMRPLLETHKNKQVVSYASISTNP